MIIMVSGFYRRNLGDFLSILDTTYFSAGFHRMDSSSVTNMGGDYNITYHTVIYNGQTGTLMTSERFSAKNDTVWLSCEFMSRKVCLLLAFLL